MVVVGHVSEQCGPLRTLEGTLSTGKLFARVGSHMRLQHRFLRGAVRTQFTGERFLPRVDPPVPFKFPPAGKTLGAVWTLKPFPFSNRGHPLLLIGDGVSARLFLEWGRLHTTPQAYSFSQCMHPKVVVIYVGAQRCWVDIPLHTAPRHLGEERYQVSTLGWPRGKNTVKFSCVQGV